MSPPHALSCFTSTASPATLPACTSSLAALPSLAALFFSCSTSFTCSTSSLATRRPCTSCPPSCTAHVTRRPARPTGRLATAALAAHRPALAALARHLLSFFSTAPALSTSAQRHLQARRRPTQPAVAHASSSPSRARCASSSPPSAPRSRLRRYAARREMARPRRRPAIFACLTKRDVAFQFIYIILYGCLRRARDSSG